MIHGNIISLVTLEIGVIRMYQPTQHGIIILQDQIKVHQHPEDILAAQMTIIDETKTAVQKLHCVKGALLDVKKGLTKEMAERLNQGTPNKGNHNFNGPPQNMPPHQMPRNNGPPNDMSSNNNLPNQQSWNNGYNGNSGNTWDVTTDNTGQVTNWNSSQNPGWNPNGARGADNWGNNTNQYPQQTFYSGPGRNYSSGRVNPYPDTKNINVKHSGNRGFASNVNNRNPAPTNNDTWQYNQPSKTGNWSNQNVPSNATWNNNSTGRNQGLPAPGGYPRSSNINYRWN